MALQTDSIIEDEAAQPRKKPNIESLHRDLAFANAYRQEFIKALILIAGALFALSVSFRPELRALVREELFWFGWIGLSVSMLGGFAQLAAWERFYSSYQRFEHKGEDGKGYRDRITLARRMSLLLQVIGFVVGRRSVRSRRSTLPISRRRRRRASPP